MSFDKLHKKELNLQSQIIFGNFLDTDIISKLVDLFNNKGHDTPKIVKYIYDERELQGLDTNNVKIESEVYGTNKRGSSLFLKIFKDNKEFIYLNIHLIASKLNIKDGGIIHIVKEIYRSKGVPGRKKNKLYAIISVKQPDGKPNSLEFSIDKDYYKTNAPNVVNSNILDEELNKEMDVIIIVLNRLFDEDNKEFYIGDKDKLHTFNNNTDKVLNNINNRSKLTTRKNKGTKTILGANTVKPDFTMNRALFNRMKKNKMTRKVRK
jgi:hypothetical protein